MNVLIYSREITPRLKYAGQLLLQHILGTDIEFTLNIDEFTRAQGIKINYSPVNIPGSFHIFSSSILFENSVHTIDPLFSHWENLPVLFFNPENKEFPFDPFAAAFWMAARYEEYLPFEPDKHGRYRASISVAFRNGFLSEPIVHLWADSLKQALLKQFPQFESPRRKFSSLSTIDVDNAWAYLHKGFVRNTGAFARDFLRGNIHEVSKRWKTLRGLVKDTFDNYEEFSRIHLSLSIVPQWFFLLGNYGKYDKNIDPRNPHFKNLIRKLAATADIGMHPSYNSEKSLEILDKEKSRLEEILQHPVTRSRQHYLKLSFPETYRRLVKLGIREDYSMGYHDQSGFRSGMCIPFPWFDLENNKQENLTIVPFQVMDVTFTEYLHLSPEKSFEIICSMIDKAASANGQFVSIWHNEPADVSNAGAWIEMYEKMQGYIHKHIKTFC